MTKKRSAWLAAKRRNELATMRVFNNFENALRESVRAENLPPSEYKEQVARRLELATKDIKARFRSLAAAQRRLNLYMKGKKKAKEKEDGKV